MDALSVPAVEDVAWLRLDEPSAVGSARRTVERLAAQLGAGEVRVAEIGLAVTEIASNVHRHGGGGALLVRAVRDVDAAAVEVVAVDSGPGIADLGAALRDRSSTAGTLGIGMGAIVRMAHVGGDRHHAGAGHGARRPVRPGATPAAGARLPFGRRGGHHPRAGR